MKKRFLKYDLFILCLLGSVLRFLYGYFYTPWLLASDQMAWEILLSDGTLSYDQLIHYPHEGGSILISIFSHFIKIFTPFNSLTIVAFLVDFGVRWIQLSIVQKVFNTKKITYSFGLWTIVGTATLVPWATINFGLHAISSFFPFVFLYLTWLNKDSKEQQITLGVFLGLAFWFSYSNIVLILVYFFSKLLEYQKYKRWGYSVLSLVPILLLHFLVRVYADAGFHLEEMQMNSIRGIEFALDSKTTWQRTYQIWYTSLANTILAAPKSIYLIEPIKYVWLLITLTGLFGFTKLCFTKIYPKNLALNSLVVLIFILIYAISPFCSNINRVGTYVQYRHLTYILPILSLLTIVGLFSYKYRRILISLFLLLALYSSSLLFTEPIATQAQKKVAEKAAGWVLVTKVGHAPKRLYRLISTSNYNKELLIQGVGWGLATLLFKETTGSHSKSVDKKITTLINVVHQFPAKHKADLIEGIQFAFSSNVTPQLPQPILVQINAALEDEN